MSYLVLARKWRPQSFDDLSGQGPIANIFKNAISQGRIAHAYLFSGPRGVGKTSTARILSKAMNCKDGPTPVPCGVCDSCSAIRAGSSVDVIEIDGASNNSVDDIRDLRERVKYAPSGGKYKVYIIDEAHMLSGSAFNALLKTLEEPPSHVIFVLATTALKKIPATILSRCQHMPFRRISSSEIRSRLQEIAGKEGIRVSPSALPLIARASEGSMRDALTILDQVSSFAKEVTEEHLKNLLGFADLGILSRVAKAVIEGNRQEILESIEFLADQGADLKVFAKELVQFFRDLLVASVVKNPEDVLDLSSEEMVAVQHIVSSTSEDQLTLMLSEIMNAETAVRSASSPRLSLEMSLIKASFLSTMKSVKEVIENIEKFSKVVSAKEGGIFPQEIKNTSPAGGISPDVVKKNTKTEKHPRIRQPAGEEDIESYGDTAQKEESLKRSEASDIDISDVWEKALKRIDPPLASKIAQAEISLQGSELFMVLNGGQAVFEDAIRTNLKALERELSLEAGTPITVTLQLLHKKRMRKKDLKKKISKQPVIKEALELFEGRIIDIIPSDQSKKTKNGGSHV
jgi:DNA polymerase-3 subunit gamma/tau